MTQLHHSWRTRHGFKGAHAVLGGPTGRLRRRPLRPRGGSSAVFCYTKLYDHSSRSAPGWLWTDLDEYASYAPVMHATLVVLPWEMKRKDLIWGLKFSKRRRSAARGAARHAHERKRSMRSRKSGFEPIILAKETKISYLKKDSILSKFA